VFTKGGTSQGASQVTASLSLQTGQNILETLKMIFLMAEGACIKLTTLLMKGIGYRVPSRALRKLHIQMVMSTMGV